MSKKDYSCCLVCDAMAIGMNFGVPTCMPCKAFFRRNAFRTDKKVSVCKGDGNCVITSSNRLLCKSCRLAKCFRVGMKTSLILSDEKREARYEIIRQNRLERGIIPNKRGKKTEPLSLVRVNSNPVQFLSSSDQVVLANISNAYDTTCIKVKNTQYPSFPSVEHTSLHAFFNEFSVIFRLIVNYFKHIPEFMNIHIDNQVRLIKNHFGLMINFNQPLMYPETSKNLVCSWTNVFGEDITMKLVKRNQTIKQFVIEPMILKLVLIILLFSNDIQRTIGDLEFDAICDNTLSIHKAQNTYIELLWKYILSRSSTYHDAVRMLNKLTVLILYVQKLDRTMDEYVNNSKKEIIEMDPVMQCMFPKAEDD